MTRTLTPPAPVTAPHQLRLRDGRTLHGRVGDVATCPRRGTIIRVRELLEGDWFPYSTRVDVTDVALTPLQQTVLLKADDRGILIRPTGVAHTLVRMGLAERHNIGWAHTAAGRAVAAHLRALPVVHRTRTHAPTGEHTYNHVRGRHVPPRTSWWTCSCGAGGYGATRDEARAWARRHRNQPPTSPDGSVTSR